MNRIEKGKLALTIIGVFSLVLSVLFLVFGIIMLIDSLAGDNIKVVKMVFGIIFILLFVPCVVFGIYGFFVSRALKATKGSLAQDNLGKGTVNATLCKNCGNQLNGEDFCPKCGASAQNKIICPKCGAVNDVDSVHCTSCGGELR